MNHCNVLYGLKFENRVRRWMGVEIPLVPAKDLIRQNHFNVRIDSFLGLFAQISWLLPILDFCDLESICPNIELTGPPYRVRSRDPNWLAHHFKITSRRNLIYHTFQNICEIDLPNHSETCITIQRSKYLLNKYLPVQDEHQQRADDFVKSKFAGPIVLGIHYRGTDKVGDYSDPGVEAPRVTWDVLRSRIDKFIQMHPSCQSIFIASDEERIKEKVKQEYNQLSVLYFNDTQKSRSGRAIHLDWHNGDNFKKGQEAIVNALILSNCDHVIRNCSFLSAFSVILNPSISTETLNHPYKGKLWFPDCEIIKRERNNKHTP